VLLSEPGNVPDPWLTKGGATKHYLAPAPLVSEISTAPLSLPAQPPTSVQRGWGACGWGTHAPRCRCGYAQKISLHQISETPNVTLAKALTAVGWPLTPERFLSG
jgi:hypothetical protein